MLKKYFYRVIFFVILFSVPVNPVQWQAFTPCPLGFKSSGKISKLTTQHASLHAKDCPLTLPMLLGSFVVVIFFLTWLFPSQEKSQNDAGAYQKKFKRWVIRQVPVKSNSSVLVVGDIDDYMLTKMNDRVIRGSVSVAKTAREIRASTSCDAVIFLIALDIEVSHYQERKDMLNAAIDVTKNGGFISLIERAVERTYSWNHSHEVPEYMHFEKDLYHSKLASHYKKLAHLKNYEKIPSYPWRLVILRKR